VLELAPVVRVVILHFLMVVMVVIMALVAFGIVTGEESAPQTKSPVVAPEQLTLTDPSDVSAAP